MSYTKNIWKSGDTVTSAKLNNIEDGIAAAANENILVVHMNNISGTLDKTWQEIHDTLTNGKLVSILTSGSNFINMMLINTAGFASNEYYVGMDGSDGTVFITDSANGYPVLDQPSENPGDSGNDTPTTK